MTVGEAISPFPARQVAINESFRQTANLIYQRKLPGEFQEFIKMY